VLHSSKYLANPNVEYLGVMACAAQFQVPSKPQRRVPRSHGVGRTVPGTLQTQTSSIWESWLVLHSSRYLANPNAEYLGVMAWAAQFQVPSKPQHVEYLGVMAAWETHKPNNVVFGVDFNGTCT
jgi:hypothetical protein